MVQEKRRRRTDEERFWQKVEKTSKCWEWKACVGKNGYGSFTTRHGGVSKTHTTHRLSWEMANGPIPPGMCVCHHCDNKRCVRTSHPSHLFLGNHQDNTTDKVMKDRHSRGSRNPKVKFEESVATEIRKRYKAGNIFQRDLAKLFGVAQSTISRIVRRSTWKHVA